MSGYSAGIATFSSCNKAGSIPHFTAHLQKYPNDYRALLWRGRAYEIIGQPANAYADYVKARDVSVDPKWSIADAHIEGNRGNFNRQKEILLTTTSRYPRSGEAWSNLGGVYYGTRDYTNASQTYQKSIDLGKAYFETGEPWYPWANYSMGDMKRYYGRNDEALEYFRSAIDSCPTLTVAHFGMCQCYLDRNDKIKAKESFDIARKLNPVLIEWPNFESFKAKRDVEAKEREFSASLQNLSGLGRLRPRVEGSARGPREGAGGARGGTSGGGGGGDGSDDDEDDRRRKSWDSIRKSSPCTKEYEGKLYHQSEDGKEWYTRDKAGHAGSFVKVYEDRGSKLVFKGSLDANMKLIRRHESAPVPEIPKRKMNHRSGQEK